MTIIYLSKILSYILLGLAGLMFIIDRQGGELNNPNTILLLGGIAWIALLISHIAEHFFKERKIKF